MCSNYHAVIDAERLLTHFGVHLTAENLPADTYPSYLSPFIRRARHKASYEREAEVGRFGLVPHWARELAMGKNTYNARSETVAQKPSFRDAWVKGQRCIVPAEWIYEPNYESGKHVSWKIGRLGWKPMGIAGLWGNWRDPKTGKEELSFTMLTVNADDHALMKRFHKPADEKRMVVILHEEDYDRWLECPVEDSWGLVRQYPAELMTAEPRTPQARDLFDNS